MHGKVLKMLSKLTLPTVTPGLQILNIYSGRQVHPPSLHLLTPQNIRSKANNSFGCPGPTVSLTSSCRPSYQSRLIHFLISKWPDGLVCPCTPVILVRVLICMIPTTLLRHQLKDWKRLESLKQDSLEALRDHWGGGGARWRGSSLVV